MTTDTTPKDADMSRIEEAGRRAMRERNACVDADIAEQAAALASPPAVEAQGLKRLVDKSMGANLRFAMGFGDADEASSFRAELDAAIDRLTAPRPASDADIAEHMRLVNNLASYAKTIEHYQNPSLRPLSASNFTIYDNARRSFYNTIAAVEASARRLAKGC